MCIHFLRGLIGFLLFIFKDVYLLILLYLVNFIAEYGDVTDIYSW